MVAEARVVGWAAPFTDAAAAALVSALEQGISLSSASRRRVPLTILSALETVVDGLDVPMDAGAATLRFRTPVVVRHRGAAKIDGLALARSVIGRSLAMARWQGMTPLPDPQLDLAISGLRIDDRDLTMVRWVRHSIRRGDAGIPMEGGLGVLRLHGPLGPLLPYLAVAAAINTGSHASLGLGWFDLSLYP